MSKKAELAMLMSDISEECWFAGWMAGNEYALWDAIQEGGERGYGVAAITDEQAERLKALSDEVGAWPVWEDEVPDDDSIDGLYLRWIPLGEWREHIAERRARRNAKHGRG